MKISIGAPPSTAKDLAHKLKSPQLCALLVTVFSERFDRCCVFTISERLSIEAEITSGVSRHEACPRCRAGAMARRHRRYDFLGSCPVSVDFTTSTALTAAVVRSSSSAADCGSVGVTGAMQAAPGVDVPPLPVPVRRRVAQVEIGCWNSCR